jgi:hypothetical protein
MLHKAALGVLALGAVAAVPAIDLPDDPEELGPPVRFASGPRYAVIDEAKLQQRRELYAPPSAIAAAKHGLPMPDGTRLTVLRFAVQLDAKGEPRLDGDGHFMRGPALGYSIMEKRGQEWRYRVFTAAGDDDHSRDPATCARCHQPQAGQDFIFTRAQMAAMR